MISVVPIERLELSFSPKPWPFAVERRAEIAARFADMQAKNPALWNGRVLVQHEHAVAGSVFRGSYLETDYASFAVWHAWGRPEAGIRDAFAQGVLCTSDGAVLVGVMADHTANAGHIYFPGGTPDASDIVGAEVDLGGSVRREIAEETGLTPADYEAEPGWFTVFDHPLIAHLKKLHVREDAASLRARILDHLARERQPELSDIRIVRGEADFDPAMRPFVTAFLRHLWAAR